MKFFLALAVLIGTVTSAAAQAETCGSSGEIGRFYFAAVYSGGDAQKKALSNALFTPIRCLASAGRLQKSPLRGPFSIAIEAIGSLRRVSITLAADEEIDAMVRRFKKGKCAKKKKTCAEAGL